MIALKTKPEVDALKKAGRLARQTINTMAAAIVPGVTTTGELDRICEELLHSAGAVPSFKGYRGFPASACISVNEEVVHGIPGPRILQEGDIVSIDVGAYIDGFHGDCAWTFPVGEISSQARRLLNVTKESLLQGVAKAREGNTVGDIGYVIQSYVERNGYGVVRDLMGHGVGRELHEEPNIPNFGKPKTGPRLMAGMTICIEPMISEGTWKVRSLEDGWTVVTADGKLSAHFEHMVLVTDKEPEVLTPFDSK